jgi:hypothetical protein
VSRIVSHIRGPDAPRSAHRFGRYRRRCSTPPNVCANRNWWWSARCPLNARPNSFCCFTWIGGVDLRYGSTADQGWTGREDSSSRLWRPAPAPGTHAKQGPSTGHSAVGLRQGGEMSPDAEATFHRASCTLGNQVVGASDGPPFRQERRPTRFMPNSRAGSGLRADTSTLRAGWSCPGWLRRLAWGPGLLT